MAKEDNEAGNERPEKPDLLVGWPEFVEATG
jgi:hypothetical protein